MGSSGVAAFPKFPDAIRGDLAGVAGLSVDDCLAGVLVTVFSSDCPLVLERSELGRTCSGFTDGTAVLAVDALFSDSSGPAEVCLGALLFGPRARPLVMCCNSGTGPDLSSCAGRVGDVSASALDADPLVAMGGGPRASIPAKPGSNRPASLPDKAGVLEANNGAG